MRSAVCAAAGMVLWTACALAQTGGARVLTFRSTVDGSEQPYAVWIPQALEEGKSYPLLVSLHGEESSHILNLRQVLGATNRYGDVAPADLSHLRAPDPGFFIACPLARGTMGYQGIAEQDIYDMLADLTRRFPIDRDRISLTGISMGGAGALRLALTRPDVWAAVAPVCPAPVPGLEEFAGNALNVPVRIFQGELDPLVPADSTRQWQRRLLDLGVNAEYLEYPNIRHNAWEAAYRNGDLFRWLAPLKRSAAPEHVRLITRSFRYGTAYWVAIDSLTPGELASIEARLEGSRLTVETGGAEGFTVTLPRTVSAVTIDGAAVPVRAATTHAFTKSSGKWRTGAAPAAAKHAGAEGPIAETFTGRHIYVYGTGAVHTPNEIEARRGIAERAAGWSTPRNRLPLSFPVKADRDVTPEDLASSDLVLFGTAETNSLIARFAPRLPLALEAGAADYGLLFIAPVDRHYVVVSSGLPWWTGAEQANRGGNPFAPPAWRLLSTFGDFILFKGSLAGVVIEGRFDRNWKVAADAAEKFRAAGTVTIH